MKKILFFCLFICSIQLAKSQITITTSDLSHSGDQYIISTGTAFSGMDVTLTGANYNWDFSQLNYVSQTTDTIFDEASTGSLLSLYYIDNGFNPNRSNQARHGNSFTLGQVNVSDVWDFFYNSSASFKEPGFGAIVNGAPLPIAYSPHDIIYTFPLTYNTTNVSPSGYAIDLTTTLGLYYSVEKERSNIVDGWGLITTPFGTFDALRVKSTIVEVDSVYIDSLGFGISLPPVTTIQYKWLAAGKGVPVLQINTSGGGIVSQITYLDSLNTTGITNPTNSISEVVVFPNPASKELFVKYNVLTKGKFSFKIYSGSGQLLSKESFNNNQAGEIKIQKINLEQLNLKAGNYLLKIESENGVSVSKGFVVK